LLPVGRPDRVMIVAFGRKTCESVANDVINSNFARSLYLFYPERNLVARRRKSRVSVAPGLQRQRLFDAGAIKQNNCARGYGVGANVDAGSDSRAAEHSARITLPQALN